MAESSLVAQVLQMARQRLADETHWTTGAFGRNSLGLPIEAQSPQAVCWCLFGGLIAATHALAGSTLATPGERQTLLHAVEDAVRRTLRAVWAERHPTVLIPTGLIHFNDTATHADVLALLDAALACEAARG